MEYQKELSSKEKSTYILECIKNINKVENCQQVVLLLESLAKTLVTAKYSKLWIVNKEQLSSYRNDYMVSVPQTKGLLSKAFHDGEIFYLNGATRDKSYKEDFDNIDKLKIKDIIYLPVKNADDSVKFIIQVMTSVHNIQQFTNNDIETFKMLLEYVHSMDLSDCCKDETEEPIKEEKEEDDDIIDKVLSFFK